MPFLVAAEVLGCQQHHQRQEEGDGAGNLSKCWRHNGDTSSDELFVHMTPSLYHFLALITTIGLSVSLVSNLIIIYLFIRTPYLRSNPSSIIAVNLSLSDLLYCTQWPLVIHSSLTKSTWMLENEFTCQAFGFITVSTALASILTVLALSVERAVVIMYSMRRRHRPTIKLAWLVNFLIWVVSLASCLPPLFGKFNRYTLDPSKTSCTLDYLSDQANHKLYILVLYVAYWIVPLIIITISYALIINTFKRSSLRLEGIELPNFQTSTRTSPQSSTAQTTSARSPSYLDQTVSSNNNNKNKEPGMVLIVERAKLVEALNSCSRLNSCSDSPNLQAPEFCKRRFFGRYAGNRRASADLVDSINKRANLRLNDGKGPPLAHALHSRYAQRTSCPTGEPKPFFNKQSAEISSQNEDNRRQQQQQRLEQNCSSSTVANASRCSFTNVTGATITSLAEQQQQHHVCTATERCNLASILQKSLRLARPRDSLSMAANAQRKRALLQFRLAKMSFYLILLWLVSWTPIATLAMINSVVDCHRASAMAVFMAITMTKLGPAFDVFIYGISHPRFKSQFKQIIKRPLLWFACVRWWRQLRQ